VSEALLSMNDGPMFEYGLKAMAEQLIKLPTRAQDYPDRDRLAVTATSSTTIASTCTTLRRLACSVTMI
jgi:hypothetical protein